MRCLDGIRHGSSGTVDNDAALAQLVTPWVAAVYRRPCGKLPLPATGRTKAVAL
jgi:hypothetical protein